MEMQIREARADDLAGLLTLYTFLNDNPLPPLDDRVRAVWRSMLEREGQHTLVAVYRERIVSTVSLYLHPTLTHGQRPFALVEYVVTHPDFRGAGCASRLLAHAEALARAAHCYKIMLVTQQAAPEVHRLYQRAGYRSDGKTAYVRRLD